MIGSVERVDLRAREIEVDFPVAGRYRFDVDGAAAARLTYGYAEHVEAVGAPLVDLRELPPRQASVEHIADVVDLPW